MKKRMVRGLACVVSLAAVAGCGVFAYRAYDGYRKEKEALAAGETAEIAEVFHDQGGIYMSPAAPKEDEAVTVRLRSSRYNVTKAQIQVTSDRGTTWECYDMAYEKPDDTGYYDLWVGEIPAKSEPYFYRFAVGSDTSEFTMYLGAEGIKSYQLDVNEMFYCMPGFDTPQWSKGALWYYIHTGQFYNGDTSNDLYREYLMKDDAYGNDNLTMMRGSGDLAGVSEKLDDIQELGVTALALGPFFSSSEMYGFGTDNMAAVETAFGTEEELKALIDEVHGRDMKITTDMIISYATNYSKYYNAYGFFPGEGAYQSQDSPYYPLFLFPQWPNNAVKVWGSMGLNIADENAAKLIYQDPGSMVLRYLNEPYGLDGFRFDAEISVGNLGYDYAPEEYFTEVRSAIKNVSEEKLFLSENCVGIAGQYNELFDSSWQKNGYFAMKDWMNGTKTGSEMLKVLQDNLINTARPRALSSYNFLGQHDVVRLWEDTEEEKNDIAALLLLQMTYLGSPVIYYGDEVGLTNGLYDNQTASSFRWDESQWDYRIRNLVKALGQARKEYSCLREGVICQGEVDDAQLFLSFGRFDDNGAVITLCNKQVDAVEREITVSRYNIPDGALLTDYLTGAVYQVEHGKVTVNVIPGGTLLVTGNTSSCRGQFEITDLGKELSVLRTAEADYRLTGDGTLAGNEDALGFLGRKAFNNTAISAQATTEKDGEIALLFREDLEADSPFYAAVVKDGKLTVLAREKAGAEAVLVTETELSEGAWVQAARETGNRFVLSIRESEDGAWTPVAGSETILPLPETIYAGMTCLRGSGSFSQVALTEGQQQLWDDFEGGALGSLFTPGEGAALSDGKLVLEEREEPVFVRANAHTSDYTFRAQVESLAGADGAMAGVMGMADPDDCVVLARAELDGSPCLVFGKLLKGRFQMAGSLADTNPTAPVTLQLQRVGSMYTAVASYDEVHWQQIGGSLYCNYTELFAGVWALKTQASFAYACFGNSLEDGVSTNTPITPGEIETGFDRFMQNLEGDKMAFLGDATDWEDIGSGYARQKAEGIGLLYCQNKMFDEVKAESTITITQGSGTAGILIGKQKDSQDTEGCYQIALDSENEVAVLLDGRELARETAPAENGSVRLVVRREKGWLHVMAGEDGNPLLSVEDTTYGAGHVAYYTQDAAASFTNYDITALNNVWNTNSTVMGSKGVIEMIENSALVSLDGVGITEGIVAFQADSQMTGEEENTFGVILGGSYGRMPAYDRVSILYNYKTGVLEALEGTQSLGKVQLAEAEGISLLVVFRNGKYEIYANQSAEPVLVAEASRPDGGGVSLYSSRGNTVVYNFKVQDITGITDLETLELVKAWRSVEVKDRYGLACVEADGEAIADDFSDYAGWNRNFYKIKTDWADWHIADGVLKADSMGKNWNIATITSGLYGNVEVKLKLRFADYTGDSLVYLNVGKQKVYAGADDSGLKFSIQGNGFVQVYDTVKKELLNGWDTYISDLDEWMELKLRAENGQVTVTLDGTELYHGPAECLGTGYVALQTDYVDLEVDDLQVTPLP